MLPVMGGQVHRNFGRMTINTQLQNVSMEEGVGFVDMRLSLVGEITFA